MKKITSGILAVIMLLVSLVNILAVSPVYASTDYKVEWTEDDFMYSSEGNIIAFSDKGLEKKEKTNILVFPEGTESINGNYSLSHSNDELRYKREFGRGKHWDKVIIPDSVKHLGYAAFYEASINEVKLSNSLTYLGGLAFFNCGLRKVTLPDTLVNIEHNAFERNNLQELTIPKSVKTIEQYAFSRNKLHTVKVLGNPNINSKGVFHNQEVEYRPKQNPFYENHFGFNGNQGFKSIPNGLKYENGEFVFDKNVDSVELEFDYNNDMYQGKMTIYNPNKYSIDTQTDLTGQDIDEKDNKIDDLTKTIKDLENQIKDLNDKKQEDQSKIDELKEKLESCKDNGEKLKQEKARLEEEIRDKDNKIAQLNKEIEDLKNSNNDELIAEITQLKDELKRLQDENAKLKEDYSSTKWELEAEKEKTDKNENKIKEMQEKLESLEGELAKKTKEIEDKDNKIKDLEKALDEKDTKIKDLESKKKETENSKSECCKKIEELQKAIDSLKESSENTKKELEEKIKGLEEKQKASEEEIKKLKEELDKKIEEAKKLIEEANKKAKEELEKQAKDEKDKNLNQDLSKKLDEILKLQKENKEKKEDKKSQDKKLDELLKADDKNILNQFDLNKMKEQENQQGKKQVKDEKEFAVFQVDKNFYNIIKDGKKTTVYMDVKAYIKDNRIMLPVRYAAYTLGFNVEYDDSKREAIFSNKENTALPKKTLRLNIDTGVMKDSQGNIYHSDTKPVIINGRIHASISNIAKAFNASCGDIRDEKDQSIEWDNSRKAVYVFKNIK
ncbi:leucine-rich repeat protein [Mediannikoviicoccus vaginalis]|uniref:leucine-rich repeat protein n=2 Tax=Bacillota TaxID=1239 RepID=UPI001F2325ED|nr:leucine-rich repeat protein [Mediannikoviicoccus vaginalis]